MRSVVVTGASRGLGFATATSLYRDGWQVIAAMRSPEAGLARLREATAATADDARLLAVRLDLEDTESIATAAKEIHDAVGAPFGIVHNAGLAGVGCLEEMPHEFFEQIFSTNLFGPVRLTRELLPSMRDAGRGRIVVISSEGAVLGMPGISAYSASKSALERWAESLSQEVTAYGVGVTVLVAGTFKTDILELTQTFGDAEGPYARLHAGLETKGRRFTRLAADPKRFAPAVARALDETRPFARHSVGIDAKLLTLGRRVMPTALLQRIIRMAIGVPAPGSLKRGAS